MIIGYLVFTFVADALGGKWILRKRMTLSPSGLYRVTLLWHDDIIHHFFRTTSPIRNTMEAAAIPLMEATPQ